LARKAQLCRIQTLRIGLVRIHDNSGDGPLLSIANYATNTHWFAGLSNGRDPPNWTEVSWQALENSFTTLAWQADNWLWRHCDDSCRYACGHGEAGKGNHAQPRESNRHAASKVKGVGFPLLARV